MIQQQEIKLDCKPRGFHLLTDEIAPYLNDLPESGLLHLFIKHTSAGLTINENCDCSVRADFETVFNQLVPENMSYYTHTAEGADDMPAHIKASLVGNAITLPITNGKLNLGTWQGIYLCEFRNNGGCRKLVITIYS